MYLLNVYLFASMVFFFSLSTVLLVMMKMTDFSFIAYYSTNERRKKNVCLTKIMGNCLSNEIFSLRKSMQFHFIFTPLDNHILFYLRFAKLFQIKFRLVCLFSVLYIPIQEPIEVV